MRVPDWPMIYFVLFLVVAMVGGTLFKFWQGVAQHRRRMRSLQAKPRT